MPKNRIAHLISGRTNRKAPACSAPPPGFAAVEIAPLAQLDVRCEDQRALYEMAYLLARTGYVVEE